MKVEALKKIIKEAVREVLLEEREALQEVSHTTKVHESSKDQPSSKDLLKPAAKESTPGDVISEMINMTRNNMTREDYQSIFNGNSSMVSKPDFRMDSSLDNIPAGPQPGLDISNLDFVKNAASIFKLAEQKSQGK